MELLTTNCALDITYYPFDYQRCDIEFASANLNSQFFLKVKLLIQSNKTAYGYSGVYMDDYSENASWDVEDVRAYDLFGTHYSYRQVVRYSFLFRRRPTYYTLSLILPVLFLSSTATLVFAVHPESGEKMSTSITVLLAFAVYLTLVMEHLPDTSLSISLLGLYLAILFGICSLSAIVTSFILRLHFRKSSIPVGQNWAKLVNLVNASCKPRKAHTIEVNAEHIYKDNCCNGLQSEQHFHVEKRETGMGSTDVSWQDVSISLDWVCFVVFSSVNVLTTCAFGCMLLVGVTKHRLQLEENTSVDDIFLEHLSLVGFPLGQSQYMC